MGLRRSRLWRQCRRSAAGLPVHWRWCFLRCNWAVAPQPDPLLEGGGPKGRGILIAEGGSFGASSPKELARRERTTLLTGSTPYDIWELPFQGLPPAARPDLRISPLRVIGRLRSEADAMKAPVGLSRPRSRPKGGMGCTTPNPYFKSRGYLRGLAGCEAKRTQ